MSGQSLVDVSNELKIWGSGTAVLSGGTIALDGLQATPACVNLPLIQVPHFLAFVSKSVSANSSNFEFLANDQNFKELSL